MIENREEEREELYDALEQVQSPTMSSRKSPELDREASIERDDDSSDQSIAAVFKVADQGFFYYTFNEVAEETGYVIKQIGSNHTSDDQIALYFRQADAEVTKVENHHVETVDAEVSYEDPVTGERVIEDEERTIERTEEETVTEIRV